MKIDYKKFNEYSKDTQKEVTDFAKMVLNLIEVYGVEKKNEIYIYDFEKGNFDLQRMAGLWYKLNEILDDTIIEISGSPTGWGPKNNRRLTVNLTFKYKPDTVLAIKSFLNEDKEIGNKHKSILGGKIETIEFLEDSTRIARIKVYLNRNYSKDLDFGKRKYWGKLYDLAENQTIDYDKGFFDYFNSNSSNPLYSKYGFILTKILKIENGSMVPNIKINLITQKKITQKLNSA